MSDENDPVFEPDDDFDAALDAAEELPPEGTYILSTRRPDVVSGGS